MKAYAGLGLAEGSVLYVEADLSCFGRHSPHGAPEICKSHLRAVKRSIGDSGTIVVPSGSPSLHRSGLPFSVSETPSEWGVFSEFVRTREGSVRSKHAFCSFTALGAEAASICGRVSPHDYGAYTPMSRMVDRNTVFLSLGLHPRYTTTTIHQVEKDVGVPYRYVREYEHPVVISGCITAQMFYRHVWYHACAIEKAPKERWAFWDRFEERHEIKKSALGRGYLYAYSMRDFYLFALDEMVRDPYMLLARPPSVRPYREGM